MLDLPRLVELIRYAGDAGIPYTRTGTNGFMFRHPESPDFSNRVRRLVDQLANTSLRNVWISLDSAVDRVHEAMRGFPGVVAGIAEALPIIQAPLNGFTSGRSIWDSPWPTPAIP